MTDLGTLGGPFSSAWAINSQGQIVGTSRTANRERHVFVWQGHKMSDIGRYGRESQAGRPFCGDVPCPSLLLNEQGQVVWQEQGRGWLVREHGVTKELGFDVNAVNNRGQILGTRSQRAVLWHDGKIDDLGVPAGVALNDSGVAVGKTFVWKNGRRTVLSALPGLPICGAVDINNRDQVLGYCTNRSVNRVHSVFWEDGKPTDLGVLDGQWVFPVALNDRGQVIGMTTVKGHRHSFLWQAGKMRDLGTLGGEEAEPTAINNAGQVIGRSSRPSGARHAFVWENGTMTDLGTLGGRDSYPVAINDQGQIVGSATLNNRTTHAVLWTQQP
jgi:probable HAF family extracellular repeat protein